ncbi:MAG: Smr/MutS family protein [Candidatus Poribacteria bacterium]|jgi:DNA-nicking Smr family endonuclease
MADIKKLPIDGTLDLHTFHPSDVRDLVKNYLIECQKIRIYRVRIIHGKGAGVLREIVHSVLSDLSFVAQFQLADEREGAWGATLANLKSI